MHPHRLAFIEATLSSTGAKAILHSHHLAVSETDRQNPSFPSVNDGHVALVHGEALYDAYFPRELAGAHSSLDIPPKPCPLRLDGLGAAAVEHCSLPREEASGFAALKFRPHHGHVSVRREVALKVPWLPGPGPNSIGEDVAFVRRLLSSEGAHNDSLVYAPAELTLYFPGSGRRCVAGGTVYFDCAVDLAAGTMEFAGHVHASCPPGKVPGLTRDELERRGYGRRGRRTDGDSSRERPKELRQEAGLLAGPYPGIRVSAQYGGDDNRGIVLPADKWQVICIQPSQVSNLGEGIVYVEMPSLPQP